MTFFRPNRHLRDLRSTESGFSLVEIVVSMFLLAIVALAFIPALAQGMRTAATNTTIATATQLVSDHIQKARAAQPTCASLQAFAAETLVPVVDSRGYSFQPHRSAVTCPISYPGVVTIAVSITQSGQTVPLASAETLVFVKAAS